MRLDVLALVLSKRRTLRAHEMWSRERLRAHQARNFRALLKFESADEARKMDERIQAAWTRHPHVHFIDSSEDFVDKAQRALAIVEHELPACCRHAREAT